MYVRNMHLCVYLCFSCFAWAPCFSVFFVVTQELERSTWSWERENCNQKIPCEKTFSTKEYKKTFIHIFSFFFSVDMHMFVCMYTCVRVYYMMCLHAG